MFKKCKENKCLNREMLDFFARQFALLKEIGRACTATQPELIADQISECVEIMEKRVIFVLDQKSSEEFHDYVADFYEDKMEKVRRELGKEMGKAKQLQGKVDELSKQLRVKEQQISRGKPVDFASVSENVALRGQLAHSQQLIAHNQEIMQEQNRALEQLQAYVTRLEEKQAQLRQKTEAKVRELDEAISAKHKALLNLTRQFERENKKRQKDFREVELQNVSFLEEKDRLEGELVIKSEEIKLLSKKVYDQSLIIGKFERAIDQSQGVLLQEKIENNRAVDQNKALRQKIRILQEQYEVKLLQKARQIKQLQAKIFKFTSSNKEIESTYAKNIANAEKIGNQLKNKNQTIKKLQQQIVLHQERYKQQERQFKKLERRQKQSVSRTVEVNQLLLQKQGQLQKKKQLLQRMKKEIQNHSKAFEREKLMIKNDIEAELQRLIDLNREILTSLHAKQKQLTNLSKNYQQSLLKNRDTNLQLNALSDSFQDAKLKIGRVQQQRKDLDYVREQLQIKLKHTQRKCEQLQRVQQQRQSLSRKCIELEETQLNSRKLLKQKENQLEKCRKLVVQENKRRGTSEQQEIKLLREQVGKKDFKIRELTAKIKQLQQQLRDTARANQIQRENMAARIKQLQVILNQQSDRTHRMDVSI